MNKAKRKVLVVGWDGATWDLAIPWIKEGRLPHLRKMMQKGTWGTLESTFHPMSAQAWATFMTGKQIGKHGIVDFLVQKPGSYEFMMVNAELMDGETLWGILSRCGKRVIVMNVPMTYPPEKVNGILISGMDAPSESSNFTYPVEFREELLASVPDYKIEPYGTRYGRLGQYGKFLDQLQAVSDARFRAARYLMKKEPWDLFVVVFRAPDYAQHWFWKFMDPSHPRHDPREARLYADAIMRTYEQMDAYLGALLEDAGPGTITVLMSDHGAGPEGNQAIYLNTWLQQNGYLVFHRQDRNLRRVLGSVVRRRILVGIVARTLLFLTRVLPDAVKKRIKQFLPGFRERVKGLYLYGDIDWSRTRAYSDEAREVIRINLRGREPQGLVEPGDEYESLRDRLIRDLSAWSDPETGKPVVERVVRREELYNGPYLDRIPDLLIQLRQDPYIYARRPGYLLGRDEPIKRLSRKDLRLFRKASGVHKTNGMCAFRGDGVRGNLKINGAAIADIAPTILALFGIRPPADMDGRILAEVFQHEGDLANLAGLAEPLVATGRQRSDASSYTEDEHELIRDRLKGLGYLE